MAEVLHKSFLFYLEVGILSHFTYKYLFSTELFSIVSLIIYFHLMYLFTFSMYTNQKFETI